MIYAAKPQRGGKSIPTNSNNPPQDPPPPNETTIIPELETNDVFIPIENTIPPVPEIITEPIITIPEKVSWFKRFTRKILRIFGRK